MNKKFRLIINILFLINAIILFSSYTHIVNFSFTRLTICSIIVLMILGINIIQIRKKDKILNDKKYNILFLFTNIIVLIIFLRDKFDSMLPLGSAQDIISYNSKSNGIFIDYNLIFITIMYGGLLIYNLINKEKKLIKLDK